MALPTLVEVPSVAPAPSPAGEAALERVFRRQAMECWARSGHSCGSPAVELETCLCQALLEACLCQALQLVPQLMEPASRLQKEPGPRPRLLRFEHAINV